MVIDSHMHLINSKCFDKETYDRLGQTIPKDTDIDQLVAWMKAAGIEHCVCMAQDMHKVWNSEFGECAVDAAFKKYRNFLFQFCSVEPIDSAGKDFPKKNYDYVKDKNRELEVQRNFCLPLPTDSFVQMTGRYILFMNLPMKKRWLYSIIIRQREVRLCLPIQNMFRWRI